MGADLGRIAHRRHSGLPFGDAPIGGGFERQKVDGGGRAGAGDYRELPPAVILDLDETVLDNSPYQARLVRDNAVYSGASWESWVNEAAAPAIAGSVAFLRAAAARGVAIFYVSNRGAAEETATRENLKRLGAPIDWRFDAVLMNGERPAWTSDKTSRRAFVAQTHRVLLIVGDDMNDFVPAKPLTLAERDALLNRYADYWGRPLDFAFQSALRLVGRRAFRLSLRSVARKKFCGANTRRCALAQPRSWRQKKNQRRRDEVPYSRCVG